MLLLLCLPCGSGANWMLVSFPFGSLPLLPVAGLSSPESSESIPHLSALFERLLLLPLGGEPYGVPGWAPPFSAWYQAGGSAVAETQTATEGRRGRAVEAEASDPETAGGGDLGTAEVVPEAEGAPGRGFRRIEPEQGWAEPEDDCEFVRCMLRVRVEWSGVMRIEFERPELKGARVEPK